MWVASVCFGFCCSACSPGDKRPPSRRTIHPLLLLLLRCVMVRLRGKVERTGNGAHVRAVVELRRAVEQQISRHTDCETSKRCPARSIRNIEYRGVSKAPCRHTASEAQHSKRRFTATQACSQETSTRMPRAAAVGAGSRLVGVSPLWLRYGLPMLIAESQHFLRLSVFVRQYVQSPGHHLRNSYFELGSNSHVRQGVSYSNFNTIFVVLVFPANVEPNFINLPFIK